MTLSGYEALFFWIFALAAIFAGLLTVMARNAVHSALFLISSLVSVAALFVLSGAEFIAGVQILVYVGGVMVLFLFVIMLVNVGAEERGRDEIFNKSKQVTASLIFCLLLVGGVLYAVSEGYPALQALQQQRTTPDAIAAQKAAGDDHFRPERRAPAASLTIRSVSAAVFIDTHRCRLKSRACCYSSRLSDP